MGLFSRQFVFLSYVLVLVSICLFLPPSASAVAPIDIGTQGASPVTVACGTLSGGATITNIPPNYDVVIDRCTISSTEPISFAGISRGSTVRIRNTVMTVTSLGAAARFGAVVIGGSANSVGDGAALIVEGSRTRLVARYLGSSSAIRPAGIYVDGEVALGDDFTITVTDGANVTAQGVNSVYGLSFESRSSKPYGSNMAITVSNGGSLNGHSAFFQHAKNYGTGLFVGSGTAGTGCRVTVSNGVVRGVSTLGYSRGIRLRATFGSDFRLAVTGGSEVSAADLGTAGSSTLNGIEFASQVGAGSSITIDSATVRATSASTASAGVGIELSQRIGDSFTLAITGTSTVAVRTGARAASVAMTSSTLQLLGSAVVTVSGATLSATAVSGRTARVFNIAKALTSITIRSATMTATSAQSGASVLHGVSLFAGITIDGSTLTASAPSGGAYVVRLEDVTASSVRLTVARSTLTATGGSGTASCISYVNVRLTALTVQFTKATLAYTAGTTHPASDPSGGFVTSTATTMTGLQFTLTRTAITGTGSGTALTYGQLVGTSSLTFSGGRFNVAVVFLGAVSTATACVKDTTNKGALITAPSWSTVTDTCWPYDVTEELDGSTSWAPACTAFTGIGADLTNIPVGASVVIADCRIVTNSIGVRVDALPVNSVLVIRRTTIQLTGGSSAGIQIRPSGAVASNVDVDIDAVTVTVTRSSAAVAMALPGPHAIGGSVAISLRSCTFKAESTGGSATAVQFGNTLSTATDFRFTVEDSTLEAKAVASGAAVGLSFGGSGGLTGMGARLTIARSTVRATALVAGNSATALHFAGTVLGSQAALSIDNTTLRASSKSAAAGVMLTLASGTAPGKSLAVSVEQHSTIAAVSALNGEANGIVVSSRLAFTDASLAVSDSSISANAQGSAAVGLALSGPMADIRVILSRARVDSHSLSASTACIRGDTAATWHSVALTLTNGTSLTVIAPSRGTVVAWPGTVTGASPQLITDSALSYAAQAAAFRMPTLGGGADVTLCVAGTTANGQRVSAFDNGRFRTGPNCSTATPTVSSLPTATETTFTRTIQPTGSATVRRTVSPTGTKTQYRSASDSAPRTATATIHHTVSTSQSVSGVPVATATATPTTSALRSVSVSRAASLSLTNTRTRLRTMSATALLTVTSTLQHTATRSATAISTATRTNAPTLTVFVPSPAPTKPESVPQAIRTADTAVVTVAGAMSVVSPVTAGVAIRLVSTARASNCEQPSEGETLQQWPRLARPLGTDYALHETSVGIARPDVELLFANATLLIALVAAAVLLGLIAALCGHDRMPGGAVREAALYNSEAQWEAAEAHRKDILLEEPNDPSAVMTDHVESAQQQQQLRSDMEAGLLDVGGGSCAYSTALVAGKELTAPPVSVYRRHKAHLLALAATCEILAPVFVFVVQLFLVPCVAASVVCVDLHRTGLIPRTAGIVGSVALTICTTMYAALTALCIYGWFWVVSHAPSQAAPACDTSDPRHSVLASSAARQRRDDEQGHPTIAPHGVTAAYQPVYTEEGGVEMVPVPRTGPSSEGSSDGGRSNGEPLMPGVEVQSTDTDSEDKGSVEKSEESGRPASALQRVAETVSRYGLDNGPEWEPRTLTVVSIIVFHLWRHLAGDGRAPLEDLKHSLRSADTTVSSTRSALHLPELASSHHTASSTLTAAVSPDARVTPDHRPATAEHSSNGSDREVKAKAHGLRISSVLPWRAVATRGAWWLGLAELTMSFWTGVAAGLARSGYCTVAPWVALVLQGLFTVLLLVAWPIRAPLLAVLQIAVQGLQLMSLSLDIAVALRKDGDSFEGVSETLAAFSDWSAVVVSAALLLAGVAAVGVRFVRTARPSLLAAKVAKWRAHLADQTASARHDTFDPEQPLSADGAPDAPSEHSRGNVGDGLEFALRSEGSGSHLSVAGRCLHPHGMVRCVTDPLRTPSMTSPILSFAVPPALTAATPMSSVDYSVLAALDEPRHFSFALAGSKERGQENSGGLRQPARTSQDSSHGAGTATGEPAINSVDITALLDETMGNAADGIVGEYQGQATAPPMPLVEDHLQTVGRAQLTATEVRRDPFLRYTGFAATGERPLQVEKPRPSVD